MNMFKIDMTGKACPLPVIQTHKALKEHDCVETIVDNKIATENLKRLADQMHCTYTLTEESPTKYVVVIAKNGESAEAELMAEKKTGDSYIVVINSPCMGVGDEEFGKSLLKTFIYTLTEQDVLPQCIVFYNGGVPLVTEDSESLQDLQKLADMGVSIYACGACLNFYGLTEKVAVGEITNMYRIVELMRTADRIVRP